MEYNQEFLGRKIKQLRLEANMSQSDLAAKSGLAKGYISSLELGKGRSVSIKSLDKLSMALGTDMDMLLSDSLMFYRHEKSSLKEQILCQLNSCTEKQLHIFQQILESYIDLRHKKL